MICYAVTLHETDVYTGGMFTTAGGKTVKQAAVYFNNFEAMMEFNANSGDSFDMGAAITML